MTVASENVGIAFVVVIIAGLSTALGSAVVFFPSLVQYADRKTLASALGLSAGVMTYVSFCEIFQKSVDSFVEAEFLEHQAYLSATLCFFAGIIMMVCLNLVIHGMASHNLITKGQYASSAIHEDDDDDESSECFQDEDPTCHDVPDKVKNETKLRDLSRQSHSARRLHHDPSGTPHHCACGEDAVSILEDVHAMAEAMQECNKNDGDTSNSVTRDSNSIDLEAGRANEETEKSSTKKTKLTKQTKKKKTVKKKDKKQLMLVSMNTAVAIALHNFPEGLATFVATLHDPAVGGVLAIAIALHNIPEGLCVSMPVYYATGNRMKAFAWGVLSGISEPIAAVFGWVVLASVMNEIVFGVLFGMVAGMMVVISIKELLPTAHRYDPSDSCVSNSFITGMAVMAFSLVLFAHL